MIATWRGKILLAFLYSFFFKDTQVSKLMTTRHGFLFRFLLGTLAITTILCASGCLFSKHSVNTDIQRRGYGVDPLQSPIDLSVTDAIMAPGLEHAYDLQMVTQKAYAAFTTGRFASVKMNNPDADYEVKLVITSVDALGTTIHLRVSIINMDNNVIVYENTITGLMNFTEKQSMDCIASYLQDNANMSVIRASINSSMPGNTTVAETPRRPPHSETTVALPSLDEVQNTKITLSASDKKRFALVIGNGSYANSPLLNPTHDADAMARTLGKLGFTVIHKNNSSLRQMEKAMNRFYASLDKHSIGLFYYAGHGIQLEGENYLVPIDAMILSESDIRYECMNAGKILGKMEDAGNAMNIIILDACRNNPFVRGARSSTRGLARIDAPTGSILAYATAPGDVAADGSDQNGLYTKYLLRHIVTPGLDINSVFIKTRNDVIQESHGKQVPWESSSLTGLFYFAGEETKTN